jgi:hypothetical protein
LQGQTWNDKNPHSKNFPRVDLIGLVGLLETDMVSSGLTQKETRRRRRRKKTKNDCFLIVTICSREAVLGVGSQGSKTKNKKTPYFHTSEKK